MSEQKRDFIPALRFPALTKYFDRVLAVTLKEERFRSLLIEQARIQPGDRVLDIGCGTGTLAVMLKQRVPEAEVTGIDADPTALEIARQKAREAGVEISLEQGLVWDAAFLEASFDCVLSSLVLHHLRADAKTRALSCAHRWLRPDGELHMADWGKVENVLMRAAYLSVQVLDGFETTNDNVRTGLVPFIEAGGFSDARETYRERTLFGTLSLYSARCLKPRPAADS